VEPAGAGVLECVHEVVIEVMQATKEKRKNGLLS
jgi:hypothetical protein